MIRHAVRILAILALWLAIGADLYAADKKLAYLVPDIRIPFWQIMARGIRQAAQKHGYQVVVLSAHNTRKQELENMVQVLGQKVTGIILSPTSSSSAVTILKFAKKASIPVVIADIGADSGDYVSYISSDNRDGAYQIGKVLTDKMQELNWQNGRVGIIAIPQKRLNGQLRTAGFMQALNEAHIKGAGIYQQVDFSYKETYRYTLKLIKENPDLRAIWLQGSDKYRGALDAIHQKKKQKEILLICFDAEPIFLKLIPQGILVGAAMQQPYLIGQKAVLSMHRFLQGKSVAKQQQVKILAVSKKNIQQMLPVIKRNVLGIEHD